MNDLNDLPEYSLSLPTWQGDGKGGFIGCKRWKRRTPEGWMIGEARIEDDEIKVTWSHADLAPERPPRNDLATAWLRIYLEHTSALERDRDATLARLEAAEQETKPLRAVAEEAGALCTDVRLAFPEGLAALGPVARFIERIEAKLEDLARSTEEKP